MNIYAIYSRATPPARFSVSLPRETHIKFVLSHYVITKKSLFCQGGRSIA